MELMVLISTLSRQLETKQELVQTWLHSSKSCALWCQIFSLVSQLMDILRSHFRFLCFQTYECKLWEIKPSYLFQVDAENYVINQSWDANGNYKSVADEIGLMVYDSPPFNWANSYTQGADKPAGKFLLFILFRTEQC